MRRDVCVSTQRRSSRGSGCANRFEVTAYSGRPDGMVFFFYAYGSEEHVTTKRCPDADRAFFGTRGPVTCAKNFFRRGTVPKGSRRMRGHPSEQKDEYVRRNMLGKHNCARKTASGNDGTDFGRLANARREANSVQEVMRNCPTCRYAATVSSSARARRAEIMPADRSPIL